MNAQSDNYDDNYQAKWSAIAYNKTSNGGGNYANTTENILTGGNIVLESITSVGFWLEGIYRNEAAFNFRNDANALRNMFQKSNKYLNKIELAGDWGGRIFNYASMAVDVGLSTNSFFKGDVNEGSMHLLNGAVGWGSAARFGLWGIPVYGTYKLMMTQPPGIQYQQTDRFLIDKTYVAPIYIPEY